MLLLWSHIRFLKKTLRRNNYPSKKWRCTCDVTFLNLNKLLIHARKHFIDVVTRETIQDEVSFQSFANHSSQAIVLESERNRNGRMQSHSVDYSGFVVGNGDGDDGGDVMMDKNK